MTGDNNIEGAVWPMPKFRFEVDLGEGMKGAGFQEVSGLDGEIPVFEYDEGNREPTPMPKMAGTGKYSNVTLKRGVFVSDSRFWEWMNEIKMNTVKRRTVLIKLLDETGTVTVQWTLYNAWPTKITGTDLKADAHSVAIDTLEIAHETMDVKPG